MKIDSSYKPTAPNAPPRANAPQAKATSPVQEDVSLSPLAGSLKPSDQQPVNSARILEIKQAISEGRFKINPEAIADRLIESARELISSNAELQA
jgi:negative regulator of flagellin synthesis FlgM